MVVSSTNPILFTVPCLQDQGGVAGFYKGVLPYLPRNEIIPLEIGGTRNSGGLLHPVVDQLQFCRKVINLRPALIHLNPSLKFKSFFRDGLFAWQAKKMGYPLLVFWHGWDMDFERKVSGKFRGFFQATFGRADGFIVLASEFQRKLLEWGVVVPVYRETTNVEESLLSGIDAHDKWADSLQLSKIKILFLARLDRAKGVFETVQAIKYLVDKKFPVCLTIAGDGSIRNELEGYVRSLSLTEQQVHFAGDIRGKEKVRAFAEHHIYCLPSHSEGLPISVLEAMAFGMPVLTRPVGGLVDIFEDGKMGAFVHSKNSEEIAECLEKMIINKERMAEIGRFNAEYAKKHFMASVVAKRLLHIYQQTIATTG